MKPGLSSPAVSYTHLTWVGCILAKDDKFYYGSYDNEITGGQLQMLRHVLGGN